MESKDVEPFGALMLRLYEMFRQEPSDTLTEMYFRALAEFPFEQVSAAADQCILSLKFFPKPVELREMILESPEDQARRAWVLLLEAARKVGIYRSVWIEPLTIANALRMTFTDWQNFVRLINSLSHEMQRSKQREFCNNYRLASKRPACILDNRYFYGENETSNLTTSGSWERGAFPDSTFYQEIGVLTDRVALCSVPFNSLLGTIETSVRAQLGNGGAHQLIEAQKHLQLPVQPERKQLPEMTAAEHMLAGNDLDLAKNMVKITRQVMRRRK